MRNTFLLLWAVIVCLATSCNPPGELQVKNDISRATMVDVQWGPIYLATELLPGETSPLRVIENFDEELPASRPITFTLNANGQSIFLETEASFRLDEDQTLLIEINDETEVRAP